MAKPNYNYEKRQRAWEFPSSLEEKKLKKADGTSEADNQALLADYLGIPKEPNSEEDEE